MPALDELAERADGLLLRHRAVLHMGVVEVDAVGAQAFEAALDAARDRRGAQPFVVPAADLGGQEDVVAVAALAHPAPEQRLALAALALLDPERVVVGGVEEAPAGVVVAVEHGERRRLVDRGAEEHGAEAERADVGAGVAEG